MSMTAFDFDRCVTVDIVRCAAVDNDKGASVGPCSITRALNSGLDSSWDERRGRKHSVREQRIKVRTTGASLLIPGRISKVSTLGGACVHQLSHERHPMPVQHDNTSHWRRIRGTRVQSRAWTQLLPSLVSHRAIRKDLRSLCHPSRATSGRHLRRPWASVARSCGEMRRCHLSCRIWTAAFEAHKRRLRLQVVRWRDPSEQVMSDGRLVVQAGLVHKDDALTIWPRGRLGINLNCTRTMRPLLTRRISPSVGSPKNMEKRIQYKYGLGRSEKSLKCGNSTSGIVPLKH